VSMFSIHSCFN